MRSCSLRHLSRTRSQVYHYPERCKNNESSSSFSFFSSSVAGKHINLAVRPRPSSRKGKLSGGVEKTVDRKPHFWWSAMPLRVARQFRFLAPSLGGSPPPGARVGKFQPSGGVSRFPATENFGYSDSGYCDNCLQCRVFIPKMTFLH